MANDDTPVWSSPAARTGFGRELAKAVLERGWRVAATARRPEQLDDLLAGHGERALKLRLDVTDHAEVVAEREGRGGALRAHRRAGQQRRLRLPRRDSRRARTRPSGRSSRPTCSAWPTSSAKRCPACGAAAAATSSIIVDRRPRELRRHRLLPCHQICRRRPVRVARHRGWAARHPRHAGRAGAVPHRLGGPLHRGIEDRHRRLCRDGRRPPPADARALRQPARRSRAGRRSRDRGRHREGAAAAAAARRARAGAGLRQARQAQGPTSTPGRTRRSAPTIPNTGPRAEAAMRSGLGGAVAALALAAGPAAAAAPPWPRRRHVPAGSAGAGRDVERRPPRPRQRHPDAGALVRGPRPRLPADRHGGARARGRGTGRRRGAAPARRRRGRARAPSPRPAVLRRACRVGGRQLLSAGPAHAGDEPRARHRATRPSAAPSGL